MPSTCTAFSDSEFPSLDEMIAVVSGACAAAPKNNIAKMMNVRLLFIFAHLLYLF